MTVHKHEVPKSLESEQACIGSMLIDTVAVDLALEKLQPDDFWDERHRTLFETIAWLRAQDKSCDIVTIVDNLRTSGKLETAGGVLYITDCMNITPTSARIDEYIDIIRKKSVFRRIILTSAELSKMAYDCDESVISIAQSAFMEITRCENTEPKSFNSLLHVVFNNIEERMTSGVKGVKTGFLDIDKYLTSLRPGEYIIIAGRPSMGKTALAMNIAQNVAEKGDGVLIFSLEMASDQLAERMLVNTAEVDGLKLKKGALSLENGDWAKLSHALAMLSQYPIYIDDKAITLAEILSKARRYIHEKQVKLIVIDYIGLIGDTNPKRSRNDEVSQISRSIKLLAKELNVPVVVLSQLSRLNEQRKDKRPILSDLRESGSIEQDCDVAMLLYRDDYYYPDSYEQGITEVIIAKQRNGPTGTVKLLFDKQYTKFRNLTR
jgi:replicative DNA helicase